MKPGDQHVYERTFTKEEVLRFAEMSGDKGAHHFTPDEKGRLMMHGLLTATMPTKLGGDMNYIAREMHFEFVKPAWSEEPLRCVGTVASVLERPTRWKVGFTFEIMNPEGELLLKGTTAGNILKKAALALLLFVAPVSAARENPSALTRAEAEARSLMVSSVTYRITTSISASSPAYSGELIATFLYKSGGSEPLRMDFRGGKVDNFSVNGRKISAPDYDGFTLVLPAEALLQGTNQLRVWYTHPYSTTGAGLYRFKDPEDGRTYIYSDFEPFSANEMFPCFDQPDIKATVRLEVEAPADWTVISTNRESEAYRKKGGTRIWRFRETPRLSTYVFHMSAGPFAVWTATASDRVPIRLFARQSLAKYVEAEEWLKVTKQGLTFFGKYFGIKYPFRKYDQIIVPDFNHGAMENIGAVTFSERYVFRGKPKLDQREDRANTILHEMAHMWFGDLVTMKWWNDLWLNESFASYMAELALAEATEFKDAWQVFFLDTKPWAYWEDQLPTTHPIESGAKDTEEAFSVFDGITYGKGASTLKQVAYYVGEEGYQKGVQQYLKSHSYGNATRTDFINALQQGSGVDLSGWTEPWLRTSGVNTLKAEPVCADGVLKSLRLLQGQEPLRPHKTAVALYVSSGDALNLAAVQQGVAYSAAATDIPELAGKPCPALVFPNYDDYDYAKVRLDPISLDTAKASLSKVADPLTRGMLWYTLWNMVLDAELPVSDYLDLALRHLGEEKDFQTASTVVESLHGRRLNSNSVLRLLYGRGEAGEQAAAQAAAELLEAFFWNKLDAAEPGSDFQKLWFDSLVRTTRTPVSAARLKSILDGGPAPQGLQVDQDRRWGMIVQLNRLGGSGAADLLAAEIKRDGSQRGKLAAIRALVIAPEEKGKADWLAEFASTSTAKTQAEFGAAMAAIFPYEQAALARRYTSDYFKTLTAHAPVKSPEFLDDFTDNLSPHTCREEDSTAVAEYLKANPSLPAVPAKNLRVAQAETDRCLKIRSLAVSSRVR